MNDDVVLAVGVMLTGAGFFLLTLLWVWSKQGVRRSR